MCLGVGKNNDTGKGFTELWNGSSWSLANTSVEGQLESVSCFSATWCMAAGESSGAARLFRLKSEGGSWSATTQTPATPSGGSALKLTDVSCSSESACTAVGSYYNGTRRVTLAERYNGSAWSVQTTVDGTPTGEDVELSGVSCASASSCMAVGHYGTGTFAESWNGTSWSSPSVPDISGATEERLQDVSCFSSGSCMTVGWYKESTAWKKAMAVRWNGSAWSLSTVSSPSEALGNVSLQDIACPSSTSCIAVGSYGTEKSATAGEDAKAKTLVESWNGTSWSVQFSPNNAEKAINYLNGVSCTSTSACTALGGAGPSAAWASGTVTSAVRYG
jgi:hypothetical protein